MMAVREARLREPVGLEIHMSFEYRQMRAKAEAASRRNMIVIKRYECHRHT